MSGQLKPRHSTRFCWAPRVAAVPSVEALGTLGEMALPGTFGSMSFEIGEAAMIPLDRWGIPKPANSLLGPSGDSKKELIAASGFQKGLIGVLGIPQDFKTSTGISWSKRSPGALGFRRDANKGLLL